MKLESVDFLNAVQIPNLGQKTRVTTSQEHCTFDIEAGEDGMWVTVTATNGPKKGESIEVSFTNIKSRVRAKVVPQKEAPKK